MEKKTLLDGFSKIKEGLDLLSYGPFSYLVDCLFASREVLLTKYAPFKVGDRIRLIKTPTINKKVAPGWMGSRYFLRKGSKGIVRNSDIDDKGTLKFYIEFDDETEDKHEFCFREESLSLDLGGDK